MGQSSGNIGHSHPTIVKALDQQIDTLSMTSRAFHNNLLYPASKKLTQHFGYEKVIFMNTGVEAVETALKFARRWGYLSKKIPDNRAEVIFPHKCFWGRSITANTTNSNELI